MSHTLSEFYRCMAEEAGHEETEDTVYDCTKILVAPNVQDAIIQASGKIPGSTDGCNYHKTCDQRSESVRQPALWTSGDSGWFYFYEMNFEKLPQSSRDYAAWKEKIYE